MATEAQISANQLNSQLSTGPKTESGKAASACNNFRHGLVSGAAFKVLPTEDQSQFDQLLTALREEHAPANTTEAILIEGMAQAHWLSQRAVALEASCFDPQTGQVANERQLALYLRYRNTHRRAFHKSLNDLLKLRAEKRKEQIGFERQQEHTRKQEKHNMKKERHQWDIFLAQAKFDHQTLRTLNRDIDESAKYIAYELQNPLTEP
jgi:hypothetical protein